MEDTLLAIFTGAMVSVGVVFWVMLVATFWVFFSPLIALILIAGPLIGYLMTKPEWINKFWKQKEYRE